MILNSRTENLEYMSKHWKTFMFSNYIAKNCGSECVLSSHLAWNRSGTNPALLNLIENSMSVLSSHHIYHGVAVHPQHMYNYNFMNMHFFCLNCCDATVHQHYTQNWMSVCVFCGNIPCGADVWCCLIVMHHLAEHSLVSWCDFTVQWQYCHVVLQTPMFQWGVGKVIIRRKLH